MKKSFKSLILINVNLPYLFILKIIPKVVDEAGRTTILAVVVDRLKWLAIKVVGMEVAMLLMPDRNKQVLVRTISNVNDIDNKK